MRPTRVVTRPLLFIPALLAVALFALALNLGNLSVVLGRITAIPLAIAALTLLMAAVYNSLKLWQFHLLLRRLGLRPGGNAVVFAFAVGELAVTLPMGTFAQNWILAALTRRTGLGRSSAATVTMLLLETWAVVLALALITIPAWPQAQLAALPIALALPAFVLFVGRLQRWVFGLGQFAHQPWLRTVLREVTELLRGCRQLFHPRVLLLNGVIAAIYLAALIYAFQLVGHGVGLTGMGYLEAASIYAFSLAVVLVGGGLFSQIGTVEVLGMAAAQAWGMSLTDGLALMLGFRLLWTGSIWLVNLPLLLLLWGKVQAQPKLADQHQKALY